MQPTQHFNQGANGLQIVSPVRENDSHSDALRYGKDKYDREDLHIAYVFLCEISLQYIKEIQAHWGIPQGGPKGYGIAQIMKLLYDRVVDREVVSVDRILEEKPEWNFSLFKLHWPITHFDGPQPSQDLIYRICREKKGSKDLKNILQSAPELLLAGRRRPRHAKPKGDRRVSPRSKKKSVLNFSDRGSISSARPDSSSHVEERPNSGISGASGKDPDANVIPALEQLGIENGKRKDLQEEESLENGQSCGAVQVAGSKRPRTVGFSRREFIRLMYLILEDPISGNA